MFASLRSREEWYVHDALSLGGIHHQHDVACRGHTPSQWNGSLYVTNKFKIAKSEAQCNVWCVNTMSVFVLFHPCSFSTPWHDAHITHIHIHGSCLAFTSFIFFLCYAHYVAWREIMIFLLSYVKSWIEQRARVLYGQCSSNGIHQKNTRSISKLYF